MSKRASRPAMKNIIPYTPGSLSDEEWERRRMTHSLTGRTGKRYWVPNRTATCEHCRGEVVTRGLGRPARFCDDCVSQYNAEKVLAHRALRVAIRDGHVPPYGGQKCTDCGSPAQAHDHRDYKRPLDVDPVCFSCNVKRGGALWSGSEKNLPFAEKISVCLTPMSDAPDCAATTLMVGA